jgi:chemotaxis protein methyltransferase CheR
LAVALVDSGQPDRAREQLLTLLASSPMHAEACWLMGKIHADRQEWTEAEQWLEQATRFDPLLVQAHYLMGLVYQQQDRPEETIAAFKRALYADHNFVLGHFSLANAYALLGLGKDARRHWSNAVKLLNQYAADDVLPFSDGLTVRRLMPAIMARLSAAAASARR